MEKWVLCFPKVAHFTVPCSIHMQSYPIVTGSALPGVQAAGAWSWPFTSN